MSGCANRWCFVIWMAQPPVRALSAGEIAHFKEQGFVVKRGLIDDAGAFAQVADYLWGKVPYDTLRRQDARTWFDAAHETWRDEDVARIGRLAHGNWKMRSPGADGIGTEPFLVQGIANHPNMLALAGRLLGAAIKRARRVRGIYAVFPKRPTATGRLGPHADYMAAQLSAMVLASDIRPRSGGFTLWPGSHLRLHPALGYGSRQRHVRRARRRLSLGARRGAARHHAGRNHRRRPATWCSGIHAWCIPLASTIRRSLAARPPYASPYHATTNALV